jgi:hypothetical protein
VKSLLKEPKRFPHERAKGPFIDTWSGDSGSPLAMPREPRLIAGDFLTSRRSKFEHLSLRIGKRG